jgi:signal transduction histidine kinase
LRRDIDDVNRIVEGALALDSGSAALAEEVKAVQQQAVELDLAYTQREIAELLTGIEDGARRTSEIVRGLRIFSRMDGDAFLPADVNELLESTLVILRSSIKEHTTLAVDLAGGLPPISCQPGRLNQVFMNVLTNAVHAVRATGRPVEACQVSVRTRLVEDAGNRWVEVRIGDNGVGMDEATRSQIFDPFFTTKEVGEGTGLGLSIAMGILTDHGAKPEVHSELGVGTSFILSFPA